MSDTNDDLPALRPPLLPGQWYTDDLVAHLGVSSIKTLYNREKAGKLKRVALVEKSTVWEIVEDAQ